MELEAKASFNRRLLKEAVALRLVGAPSPQDIVAARPVCPSSLWEQSSVVEATLRERVWMVCRCRLEVLGGYPGPVVLWFPRSMVAC
jgi:hypothetical protein